MALKKDIEQTHSTGSGTTGNTQDPNRLYSVLTDKGIAQSTTKPTYNTNSYGRTTVAYTKPINNGTSSIPVTHVSYPVVKTDSMDSSSYDELLNLAKTNPSYVYNSLTQGQSLSQTLGNYQTIQGNKEQEGLIFSNYDELLNLAKTNPSYVYNRLVQGQSLPQPDETVEQDQGNFSGRLPSSNDKLVRNDEVNNPGVGSETNSFIGDLSNKYGASVNELSWYIDQFKQRNPDLFDFTSYDELLASLENAYNNNVTSIEEAFNLLQDKLNRQRQENAKAFAKGRVTASENAYDTARQQQMALASRGLAGSGLQQLGEVQNRMELGRQLNDLADSYYQASQNLNDTEKEAVLNKVQQLRSLSDQLSSSKAQVNIQRQNAVTQANSLAEQLSMSQRAQDLSNAQFYDSMDNNNYWNSQSLGLQREQLEMQKQQLAQSLNEFELQYMNSANAIAIDSSLTQTEKINLMNSLDEAYRGYGDEQKFNNMSALAWATLNSENDKIIAEIDNSTKDRDKFLDSIISAKKSGQIVVDENNFDSIYETYVNKRRFKIDTKLELSNIKSKSTLKQELGIQ